jgi:hypothetical protein
MHEPIYRSLLAKTALSGTIAAPTQLEKAVSEQLYSLLYTYCVPSRIATCSRRDGCADKHRFFIL